MTDLVGRNIGITHGALTYRGSVSAPDAGMLIESIRAQHRRGGRALLRFRPGADRPEVVNTNVVAPRAHPADAPQWRRIADDLATRHPALATVPTRLLVATHLYANRARVERSAFQDVETLLAELPRVTGPVYAVIPLGLDRRPRQAVAAWLARHEGGLLPATSQESHARRRRCRRRSSAAVSDVTFPNLSTVVPRNRSLPGARWSSIQPGSPLSMRCSTS